MDGIRDFVARLDTNVEWSESVEGGAIVLRNTGFPLSHLFAQLADGDNIDRIAQRFHVDRDSLSAILHGIERSLSGHQPLAQSTPAGGENVEDRIARIRSAQQEGWDRIETLGPSDEDMAELRVPRT
ncbi:MAG: DUF433 domain-containing protein [Pirellulales bacterium]